MGCLLQLFFVKRSSNFFFVKNTNNIYPWHSVFNFFSHNTFFRSIWDIAFAKIFHFHIYFYISQTSHLVPFLLFYSLNSICMLSFKSTGFIFLVLWYVTLYLFTTSSNLSINRFFCFLSHVVISFVLSGSNKSFRNSRFF